MGEFILTWNPSKWSMEDAEYDERLRATAEEGEFQEGWSVGGRTGGIYFGDHAYLWVCSPDLAPLGRVVLI